MVWAVDQGLIKGYVNQIHPRGVHAGIGNWVDPHGSLTEAQLLSILFRYTHQAELENTAPKDPFWASTAYQLAHKYNVPTKGSLSNKAEANKGTTRGQLATTLATIHFGKQVSLREAVDFMYETGITYGRTDAWGNSPMTFESFGANDPLQRAHITSFMKRYHDYLQKGGSVNPAPPTSQPAPPTTQPTPPPTSSFEFSIKPSENNRVGNITVHYGQHTYGSKNQAEYNEVMKRVHDAINKDLASTPFMSGHNGALYQYFDNFMAGERPIMDRNHPDVRSSKNVALRAFETSYKDLRDAGVKKNTIEEVAKAGVLAVSLMSHAKDPRDGTPNSAHDAIVKGLIDCDAEAQVYSAVYDSLGYTTAILARPGHAFVVIKIEGNWYLDTAGVYTKVDMKQAMSQGLQVVVPPTDGSTLR
ncbi:hypothetical protein A33I_20050 [Alkalihalophilus marmarensis DSM 21297]|uniref:S-layer homology domain-containing protein n=2 Tax=Alkalihalophilus TaxID=2893060 RepID=U6SJ65_9BACI|nr:hypothetical protein A33I_20050 [Alkalihalophilus marmarensis DSM 21297]